MIFVDSGAWFSSVAEDDIDHAAAAAWMASNSEPLLTSDYVVDETLTLLRARGKPMAALALGRKFFHGNLATVHHLSSSEVLDVWRIFQRFSDKEWSFTDCSSRLLIEKYGIRKAFSLDGHFHQFGLVTVVP